MSSFSLKNKSTLVKNTPSKSSILNVCASGSGLLGAGVAGPCSILAPAVILSTVLLTSFSVTVVERIIGTLVDSIVSCFVNCKPRAVNVLSAKVSTSSSNLLFVDELVNLNTLLPVLNLLASVLGKAKVPDTVPTLFVTKLPPATPPSGVTKDVMFTLSKNGNTLVLGFNLVAVNEIVCDLIKGINAMSTTLSPNDVLCTFDPVISLLIPVLVLLVTVPDTVALAETLPACAPALSDHCPDQLVCQLFQTVPKLLVPPASAVIVSNKLLSLIIKSGLLSVSYHSSLSGVNAISP